MNIDIKYLQEKEAQFRQAGEQHKHDAVANFGAADGIAILIKEIEFLTSKESGQGETPAQIPES
jgi:hypothetical protein